MILAAGFAVLFVAFAAFPLHRSRPKDSCILVHSRTRFLSNKSGRTSALGIEGCRRDTFRENLEHVKQANVRS
jgi:hypothetical protein